jgi:protein gp37
MEWLRIEYCPTIDWLITGGESGPSARTTSQDAFRCLRDQCEAADLPFFFKQIGGVNKKEAGRMLDGRTWDEMPEIRIAGHN